jgi:tetratricopeptide (TPR) repeat protein
MSSRIAICWFFAITVSFARIECAAEGDYATRFKELQEQKSDAPIEPLLNEWREKLPDDPEAWITSANYYFNQRQVMISTKKAEKEDFSLRDAKTGKKAGSISFEQAKSGVKRAAQLLQEATTKFPDRLDIWCGLAFIHQQDGDFDSELLILHKMVAYSRDHPAHLQWKNGENLQASPDQFIAEKLHGYGMFYERKENPEDDKRFLKIAMFATEQFSNLPYAFNDVAQFYFVSGDKKKAREWLEKASRIDPKDVLVLMNLGQVCSELGDNLSARKWYEEVLKVDPKGEYSKQAKDALSKLKK